METRSILDTENVVDTITDQNICLKRHVSNIPTQVQRVNINVSIIYKKTNSSEQVKAKKVKH